MADLPEATGVAVDLYGCPNRCRHCYLGNGPNNRLTPDDLKRVAEAFWDWKRQSDKISYFKQVFVSSSYREPDFSDDYQKLYELERELSRCEPRRYELLSVRRLAGDPGYALWAKEHGPQVCQITFFGMEGITDDFFRRRGAFKDNLAATERLLQVGMIPRWQIILTKPGMKDLSEVLSMVEQMRLSKRTAELGAEFTIFCHPPGPVGEAWNLESQRIDEDDAANIPEPLANETVKHFGEGSDWKTEAEWVEQAESGEAFPREHPGELWFLVNSEYDVFSNYGDMTDGWKLGNFQRDDLDAILAAFESDRPTAMRVMADITDAELASRFGRRNSRAIYSGGDVRDRWVRLLVNLLQR
ncbi:MAG TPA: radical SAM protein [Candidatus Brocadiia bacterium]|nr:radical SAM protein [Candidatus Brocadiia bacterium]